MKASLIAEIEQIYRDAGYRRTGKPLEQYPVELLRTHLEKLQEGAFSWITGATTAEGGGATPAGGDARPTNI